jgi:phosphonate transport system permease protein
MSPVDAGAREYPEPVVAWISGRRLRFVAVLVLLAAFYSLSWHLAGVDLGKLAAGLPKMAAWAGKAWPPATDELPILLRRTA